MMNGINILTKPHMQFEVYSSIDFPKLTSFLTNVAPLYPNFDTWLNFTFRRNLLSGERQIALAHNGSQILGTALLKNSIEEKKICTFYVAPNYRNLNIGSQLMDLTLSTLDSHRSFITVSEERKNELNPLLSSKGFTISNSVDGLYRKNSTEHFYTL
jgi:ribosomal protein S18 acetylase RimI-like enzyme